MLMFICITFISFNISIIQINKENNIKLYIYPLNHSLSDFVIISLYIHKIMVYYRVKFRSDDKYRSILIVFLISVAKITT